MEDIFFSKYLCGVQAKRMAGKIERGNELDFQRRLSGVVFKSPYAAIIGNNVVVNDKEKRGQ